MKGFPPSQEATAPRAAGLEDVDEAARREFDRLYQEPLQDTPRAKEFGRPYPEPFQDTPRATEFRRPFPEPFQDTPQTAKFNRPNPEPPQNTPRTMAEPVPGAAGERDVRPWERHSASMFQSTSGRTERQGSEGVTPLPAMNTPSTDEVSNRNRNGFSMNTIEDSGFSSSREAAAVQARPGTNEAARHEFDPLYPEPSQAAAPKTRGKADLPESEAPEKRNGAAPPPDSVEETSLSSLMSRLFSEHLGTTPVMTSPVAQTAPAEAPRTAEMVDHLVDQILVSHPDTVGEREVRLRVNSSVLPDTEIRLSRGADGLLSVTLTTGRADSFQTLVAAQADLKQALDSRENREVRLVVSDAREAGAEDGNSDRRSRGYTDYAPDDGGMR